jgi:hypothetical protein
MTKLVVIQPTIRAERDHYMDRIRVSMEFSIPATDRETFAALEAMMKAGNCTIEPYVSDVAPQSEQRQIDAPQSGTW